MQTANAVFGGRGAFGPGRAARCATVIDQYQSLAFGIGER